MISRIYAFSRFTVVYLAEHDIFTSSPKIHQCGLIHQTLSRIAGMSNNPTFPSFGSTARSPYDPSADDEDWQSDAPAAPSRDTNAPDMMQYVPPMDRRRLFDQSLSDADMLAMQEQFMRSGAAPSATMFRRQQPSRNTQSSSTSKPIQHTNTSTHPAFERHPVDPAKLAALGIPTHSADEPIDRNDHAHPSKQLRRGAPTDDDDFDDQYDDMRTFSRSTGGEIAPSAILIRAPKPVGGIGRLENAKLAVSRYTIVKYVIFTEYELISHI